MSKTVKFVVVDGKMKIDFEGFEGNDCDAESEEFRRIMEEEFGVTTEMEDMKRKRAPRIPVRKKERECEKVPQKE